MYSMFDLFGEKKDTTNVGYKTKLIYSDESVLLTFFSQFNR